MMSNLCTHWGALLPKKLGEGEIFSHPLRLGGVVQNFPGNNPWKDVPKTGIKILGAPQRKFVGRSKLAQISWFSDFLPISPKQCKISPIQKRIFNLRTFLYQMVKKWCVLRSTTNYVIQSRKHPPSDLTAGLYTKRVDPDAVEIGDWGGAWYWRVKFWWWSWKRKGQFWEGKSLGLCI